MRATTRRCAAGALPITKKKKKKKKKAPALGFMCGCGGSKSVSTVSRVAVVAATVTTPMKATAAAKTTIMPDYRDTGEDDEAADASAEGTPSVDALLQQLRELERGVRALGVRERDNDDNDGAHSDAPRIRPRHRRSATEWGSGGGGRLEAESVAVVTESADPRGDFRRSMVQMVVENGITGGAELRELLQRFLSLNSPRHHHLILRAFADVWEELFAGAGGDCAPPPPPPPPLAEGSHNVYRAYKRPCIRADTLTTSSTPYSPVR